MKNLLTILLFLVAFGCNGQEPDVCTYSEEYLLSMRDFYLDSINKLTALNTMQLNEINEKDSLISLKNDTIHGLRIVNQGLQEQDTTFSIVYDSITYEFNKNVDDPVLHTLNGSEKLLRLVFKPDKIQYWIRKEDEFLYIMSFNF